MDIGLTGSDSLLSGQLEIITDDFLAQNESIDTDDEHYEEHIAEESTEDPWFGWSLLDRWKDVMQRLLSSEIRWDDDDQAGDHDLGTRGWSLSPVILDTKKKKSLADVDRKDRSSPTILHRLALDFGNEGFKDLANKTQVKILEFLLCERKENLQHTEDLDPILTRAIEYQNVEFIVFIHKECTAHLPDLLDARDNRGANCLHYLLKHHLPAAADHRQRNATARKAGKSVKEMILHLSYTVSILFAFSQQAKPSTVTARDEYGNTPIHYAVDYKICRIGIPQYPNIVLQLITKGDKARITVGQFINNNKESPYLYFMHTQSEFLASRRKQRQERAQIESPASSLAAPSKTVDAKMEKREAPDSRTAMAAQSRSVDVYSRGPSVREAHRKMNPRDTGATRMRQDPAAPSGPPSHDGRDEAKKDNIVSAKEPGLMNAPPGFGLSRSRTGDPVGVPTDSKGPTVPTASPIEKTSTLPAGGSASSMKPLAARKINSEKQVAQRTAQWEESAACREAAENVRRKLKLHYIRSRSDMEAKELLYGRVASDKNIYFDATHLKGKSPGEVADLVLMLANPGGFEDTLSYVSLPVLSYTSDNSTGSSLGTKSYDANERRQREAGVNEDKLMGRNSVVAVLDKLAQVGVRTILRLIVEEDTKSPPHTDSAIERAIYGEDSLFPENKRQEGRIDVEVWDWKKFDLSTDVITFSSSRVNEVNLYWSGNQTVLRGWASDEGIPRLYQKSFDTAEKGYCLRTIIIHWTPGFEGYKRCETLLQDFKKRVELRTWEVHEKKELSGVIVHTKPLKFSKADSSGADSYLGPFTPGNPRAPPDHGWIESMEKFRRALMRMHNELPQDVKPERVKVALIDDGIDRTNLLSYDKRVEVTGMSYWSSSAGRSLPNPSWHQSTHGHGTIMANSIVRVNPWVSLYAMRIQDEVDLGPRNEISLRIHAGSAARAIEDAIIRKVHIISISWTIRNLSNLAGQDARTLPEHEIKALDALRTAIDKAKKEGILIFCSASDDIQKKGLDTLPYSQAREYAFRIGAADAFGWSDKATEDQKTIDWFFPGNQVADDFNPRAVRTSELKNRDGSSVATALAAGLASLILYLTNVMRVYYRSDARNADRYAKFNRELQNRDKLKRSFENIMTMDDDYKDKKFLPVWNLFGAKAEEISKPGKDSGPKWDDLVELCNSLYSGIL